MVFNIFLLLRILQSAGVHYRYNMAHLSFALQAACQTHTSHVTTGCGDGSVRVYDIRSREM